MGKIGVLSVHLDGAPCKVGCPFCYLGGRVQPLRRHARAANDVQPHRADELVAAVEQLDYAELAIALSESPQGEAGSEPQRATIARLVAAANARGLPVALTTTADVVLADPTRLSGAARLNLSVDPWKMPGDEDAIIEQVRVAATAARAHVRDVVAIATLSTPGFAQQLVAGLLARMVDMPELDGVALNALKPPPPFCDRAFWLAALAQLRPLLDRALDRRLYLDCYVAARLLGIGGCPGRADLSPGDKGVAFRSCVYAARPDREGDAAELARALTSYVPPTECPFDTRLA